MEFVIVAVLLIFVILYRINKGEGVYKFISHQARNLYDKYAPYSFKVVREKVKELGLEFTPRQYGIQVLVLSIIAGVVSYMYFYNIFITIIYIIAAISIIPYLTYLRCKRIYSEFIFEQIQIYTTNTIMEFATTEAFVKSLEGVVSSGVLEEPVLSDVKEMIRLSYEEGDINHSIEFMNEKYPYYIVKNMHQLFLQVTKEGAKDTAETFENMLSDIDLLVENVYRDRMDRQTFHRQFIQYGIILYFLIMLTQLLLGVDTYISMLKLWYVKLLIHAIIIINSYFLLSGEKYYNENVGAE